MLFGLLGLDLEVFQVFFDVGLLFLVLLFEFLELGEFVLLGAQLLEAFVDLRLLLLLVLGVEGHGLLADFEHFVELRVGHGADCVGSEFGLDEVLEERDSVGHVA